MQNVDIVFDIDSTIATGFYLDDISILEEIEPWVKIFRQKGLFIHALKPHVIHPGTIELIQVIDQIPSARMSFFSTGNKERNAVLVEKLLRLALGEKRYEAIKDQVVICSDTDVEKDVKNAEQYYEFGIGGDSGRLYNKKNLRKILSHGEFSWIVLLEDTITYSYHGQEKNLLVVPGADAMSFSSTYYYFKQGTSIDEYLSRWEDFCEVNHIFYITGLLFTAIELAEKEGKTISDVLLQIQFKANPNKLDERKMIFDSSICRSMSYFEYGLKKLKEVNPSLCFVTSEDYLGQYNLSNVLTQEFAKNIISNSNLHQTPSGKTNEEINNVEIGQLNVIHFC